MNVAHLYVVVPGVLWTLASFIASSSAPADEVPPAPDGTFSVVALPDTQDYVKDRSQQKFLTAEIDWILANLKRQKIVFVTHVGDIVDTNVESQWRLAHPSALPGRPANWRFHHARQEFDG